jgi:hypothetical protein
MLLIAIYRTSETKTGRMINTWVDIFDDVPILEKISGLINPEIHHFNGGTHPGDVRWSIKTIIPGELIINDQTKDILILWQTILYYHPTKVSIIERAYDWNGNIIDGWWTVFLDQTIDIIVTDYGTYEWDVVDFNTGMKVFASKQIDKLKSLQHSGQIKSGEVYSDQMLDILEFLKTYTSDENSKLKRNNLRILDCEQEVYTETDNRKQLDIK